MCSLSDSAGILWIICQDLHLFQNIFEDFQTILKIDGLQGILGYSPRCTLRVI